jgi:hypothetical protein
LKSSIFLVVVACRLKFTGVSDEYTITIPRIYERFKEKISKKKAGSGPFYWLLYLFLYLKMGAIYSYETSVNLCHSRLQLPRGSSLPFTMYQEMISYLKCIEAHGSVVVKALCYKVEGRGFATRCSELIFSIYLILPAALGPAIYSPSSRNKYQKQKNNLSGE